MHAIQKALARQIKSRLIGKCETATTEICLVTETLARHGGQEIWHMESRYIDSKKTFLTQEQANRLEHYRHRLRITEYLFQAKIE